MSDLVLLKLGDKVKKFKGVGSEEISTVVALFQSENGLSVRVKGDVTGRLYINKIRQIMSAILTIITLVVMRLRIRLSQLELKYVN